MRYQVMLNSFTIVAVLVTTSAVADVDARRDSVVVVTTASTLGAGVVVGSNSKNVYVATAAHVVTENDGASIKSRDAVRVTFNSSRDQSFPARVFSNVKADLDFAVIIVEVPSDDPVRQSLRKIGYRAASAVDKLTAVGSICHTGGSTWVTNAGVNKVQDKTLTTFSVSNTGIAEGCSGGPLLDDDGRLIGIFRDIGQDRATAVTIDSALDALTGWNIPTNLIEKDDTCYTVIRSSPDGANVLLNGSAVGVTPLKISLKEGAEARVRLVKDGYNETTRDVSCGAREVILTLPPADCKVVVTTTPSEADVSADGQSIGTTPTTVRVPQQGNVTLHVEKEGYAPIERVVNCQRSSVALRLEKTEGTIKIAYTGDPNGCSLQISVLLGEKHVHPTSNLYTVHNAPLGEVSYEITGQIGCPMRGACKASGSGNVTIRDGDTLQVVWQNTGYAACEVSLVSP